MKYLVHSATIATATLVLGVRLSGPGDRTFHIS